VSLLRWLLGGWAPGPGELEWGASGPELALVLGCALLVLAASWFTAGPVRGRGLQAALLAVALAALTWALARPSWVERGLRWEEGRFVVLVDDSRSMAVGEASIGSELERVMAAIDQPDAELFRFGAELSPGMAARFQEPGTDLGAALHAVAQRYAGERLAGVAVISDGLDRGALRRGWQADGTLRLPELPGPLSLYGAGSGAAQVDLSVVSVATGGFAFIRAPFELRVVLAGTGYSGRRVPVTLTRDGALVERRTVQLDEQGEAELVFRATPSEVGRHAYRVELPVDAEDAVPGNNGRTVVVRVVRDRMRVLQVCGSPSLDQKFLRRFLKQDPSVDLVSFFILRTHEDMSAGYGDGELALIPFPTERLFTQDLWTFDLVVFQNFDYDPYFGFQGETLLENIADYVRQGGALVMVGGDRSFDLGGYASTALAAVLPVRLGGSGDLVDVEAFQPVLTAAGRRHPVTALASDPAESEAAWAKLAPLDGLNTSQGTHPQAAVLLAHPELEGPDGAPLPVVALRHVGQGRSLAFMGDSSWRWAFAEAAKGRGNQAYLRFWKSAMRWLVGDPEAQRVTVESARANYGLDEEVRVLVRVRDPGFEPLAGVTVQGSLQAPEVAPQWAELSPQLGEDGRFELETDASGEAVLSFTPRTPGAWRVQAEALDNKGRVIHRAGTVLAVTERDPELDEIVPDLEFLQAVAEAAGGAFHPPGQAGPPEQDPGNRRSIEQLEQTPLWDVPLVALLVGLFGSASWWLRRRAGGR